MAPSVSLTDSQRQVILDTGDAVVLAGPGSGKTLVLVEKVAHLVEAKKVPLSQILLLTFTEKAAGEIKGRLSDRLRVKQLETETIGTIHSALATFLRTYGEGHTIRPDFQILDEPLARLQKMRAAREFLHAGLLKEEKGVISFVSQFGLKTSLKILSELMTGEAPENPYSGVIDKARSLYEGQKRRRNLLDFDDLEILGLALLKKAEICEAISRKISWILIDEFQDTNRTQWEVALSLYRPQRGKPSENHLVIVGDPRQSIYRFRGAHPEIFREAVQKILSGNPPEAGRLFHLDENFRSDPAVIDFINRLTPRLFPEDPRRLIAKRTAHNNVSPVRIRSLEAQGSLSDQRLEEARQTAREILSLRQEGYQFRQMALLFRTRRAMPVFETVFRDLGIPFQSVRSESLLERPEILTATLFLKRQFAPEDPIARIALESFDIAVSLPEKGTSSQVGAIFETLIPQFPKTVRPQLEAFQGLLQRLLSLEETGLPVTGLPVTGLPVTGAPVTDLKGLWETIQALRADEARIPCPEEASTDDHVSLLTVHAAKGLEFPVVFLSDLGSLPSSSPAPFLILDGRIFFRPNGASPLAKPDDYDQAVVELKKREEEESRRLLYVGLSRARERLILTLPPKKKKGARPGGSPGGSWSGWFFND